MTTRIRTEEEMFALLLNFAEGDEQIRLVTLEGSRSNPQIRQDSFQDYDVSYWVSKIEDFKITNVDDQWLDHFGSRIILQKPEAPYQNGLSYLMLLEDGNRIDLFVLAFDEWENYLAEEASVQILLDKDQRVKEPHIFQATMFQTDLPTAETFSEMCNEFWWVSTYVVKGLCRGEYLYAIAHFEQIVRPVLLSMLAWQAVSKKGGALDLGKEFKFLPRYLDDETEQGLISTYNLSSEAAIWSALLTCQELFFEVSQNLASTLDFPLEVTEAESVRRYTQLFYEGGSL